MCRDWNHGRGLFPDPGNTFDTGNDAIPRQYQDDTVNAAFVPGILSGVVKDGVLTTWTAYFALADVEVYLQVWRPNGTSADYR